MLASGKKSYDKPRQHIKKQRDHFDDKVPYSWSYGFSSTHVRMWELDHKEEWLPKDWCFLTVVLESPLDYKEIKPVNPKRKSTWVFFGRTYAEAEAPILWPPDVKSWLIRKDPDAGKDLGQEEKGMTERERERETVGWHHWLNGHEFEQTLGCSEGQGSLACCSPWGHKELDVTERLNNNNLSYTHDIRQGHKNLWWNAQRNMKFS